MEQMTLEQAKRIAQEGDYGLVPLTRELYADAITPTAVSYTHLTLPTIA